MQKDFDTWNMLKKEIHENGVRKFCHVREIWWCTFGINIGNEQDGSGKEYRRPVVILKGLSIETCLIIPLTSSSQKHHLRLPVGDVNGKNAQALLSQIRVIDTRRLVRKIGYLEKEKFEIIRKAVRDML
jgi:mRNA-degrading endonuclease toxin of MazEF toxin-antitoxin module